MVQIVAAEEVSSFEDANDLPDHTVEHYETVLAKEVMDVIRRNHIH